MNIVFQLNPSSLLQSSTIPPATTTCSAQAESLLRMGPGLENDSNLSILSADDSSMVDVSTSSVHLYSEKEEVPVQRHSLSCFGLPYQDHNYGAPPPPTPPTQSPHLSPAYASPVVETETVSITTTYENEDAQEASITRCVCGFDHDDEYMICCDRCLVWQHVDCMGLDRNKIPETYLCEQCEPRRIDKHRAKVLQSKKKVHLRDKSALNTTSGDSEGDASNQNLESHAKVKNRNSRRRNTGDKETKNEPAVTKKTKAQSKQLKERMEMKRSKLRRRVRSKSETNCSNTPDEEAQDAWKCSFDWKKNNSADNWYSDDVKILASALKNQGDEAKISKQLQAQLYRVVEIPDNAKKLVADQAVSKDHLIIEWKGRFFSSSEFHLTNPLFKQRLFPFVLLYKVQHSSEELFIDSTDYANDARFVRRSCIPNAEVKQMVFNGSLHLYISSTKDIAKDEEITIPFDVDTKVAEREMAPCACGTDSCQQILHPKNSVHDTSERRKRGKRHPAHSTDDDSNHSLSCIVMSPSKSSKGSPTKTSTLSPKMLQSETSEQVEHRVSQDEQDGDEQHKENKRKMTREERKLDAIMRAFDQMEKAAKRRQQALDRIAHQRQQSQKSDESPPPPPPPSSASLDKQESNNSPTTITTVSTPVVSIKEEEEKPISLASESNTTLSAEEEKPSTTSVQVNTKSKKGKRRRGSGTQTRRRTRSNSGGSDVFNVEEASSHCDNGLQCLSSASSVEASDAASVESSIISPCTTPLATTPVTPPVLPKTKRFLHHEWLQEKAEIVPLPSPSSVRSEMNFKSSQPSSGVSYVNCVKDNPNGGISAAHMRRSSVGGTHCKQTSGSAKKRWLRQAMHDCEPMESEHVNEVNGDASSSSPLYSPSDLMDTGPCAATPDDILTPLKKRRIMRNTLQSSSSSAEWTLTFSGTSPDHSSSEAFTYSVNDSKSVTKALHVELNNEDDSLIDKCHSGGNGVGKHLLKSLRESWVKNQQENLMDVDAKEIEACVNVLACPSPEVKKKRGNDTQIHLYVKAESSSENTASGEDTSTLNFERETEKEANYKPLSDSNATLASVSDEDKSTTESDAKNIPCNSKSNSEEELEKCETLTTDLYVKKPIESVYNGEVCQTSSCKGLPGAQQKCVSKQEEVPDAGDLSVSANCFEEPSENVGDTVVQSNKTICGSVGGHLEEKSVVQSATNAQITKTTQSSCESVTENCVCTGDMSRSRNSKHQELCDSVSEDLLLDRSQRSSTTSLSENNESYPDPNLSMPKKRKVTLSEYRQRKRDNHCPLPVNADKRKSNNCVLESADTLEVMSKEEIKLAALPLFDKSAKKASNSSKDNKADKSKQKQSTVSPSQKREKLSDRLKREFGVEDISDSKEENKLKTNTEHQTTTSLLNPTQDISTHQIIPYCAPPVINNTTGSVAKFNYASGVPPQSYAQPSSFIVSKVPSGQYVEGQNHKPLIPAMHSLGVATAAQPPPPPPPPPPPLSTVQQGCTYSVPMHSEAAVRSQAHFFYPNNQTYASATQPQTPRNSVFTSPFKSRAYK